MRAFVQRVARAKVIVNGETIGAITRGLLVLAGYEDEDSREDIEWVCGKISRMRLFADQEGRMNLDVNEVDGELLVVS